MAHRTAGNRARLRRVGVGRLGVAADGLPLAAGLAAAALAARRRPALAAGLALAAAGTLAFFRDPLRPVTPDAAAAYAASDGRVLAVERLAEPRLGPGEWLRVAVFLSLADVHINRSPVAGRVAAVIRAPGAYVRADHPRAEHNNAVFTLVEGAHGPVVVAQRVGAVARRIVTWAAPGADLAQGERIGLIRFGSRTDVYLPAGRFVPCVAPGERVRGGQTVIAWLRGERSARPSGEADDA